MAIARRKKTIINENSGDEFATVPSLLLQLTCEWKKEGESEEGWKEEKIEIGRIIKSMP